MEMEVCLNNAKALRPTLAKSNRRDVSEEITMVVEYLSFPVLV
jgi:hypothetical protein